MDKTLYSQNAIRINRFIGTILKYRDFTQLKRLSRYGINYLLRPDHPKSPLMAVIDITNKCNLQCEICPRQSLLTDLKTTDMPLDKFKYIVDQLSLINSINISGIGEPFLHKDLFKMVHYIKSKKMFVSITSNGTVLTKERARQLIDAGVDVISFSLDTPNPATYEKVRKGAHFDKTIENIGNLVDIKKQAKAKICIKINMTASNENYQEISDFVDLGHRLGIDIVEVNPVRCDMDGEQFLPPEISLHLSNQKDKILAVFAAASEKAKKQGINLTLPSLDQPTKWTSCLRPWYSSFITITGDVRQCCASMQVFGNVFEDDLLNIWGNEQFINLRKRLRKNDLPKSCVNCIFL